MKQLITVLGATALFMLVACGENKPELPANQQSLPPKSEMNGTAMDIQGESVIFYYPNPQELDTRKANGEDVGKIDMYMITSMDTMVANLKAKVEAMGKSFYTVNTSDIRIKVSETQAHSINKKEITDPFGIVATKASKDAVAPYIIKGWFSSSEYEAKLKDYYGLSEQN